MDTHAHTTRERSPWAFISIFIALLFFGLFWIFQRNSIKQNIPAPATYQARVGHPSLPNIDALEASAVNIAIPNFETAL